MKILITGAAGFIGFHLSRKLINKFYITGLDSINSYYLKNIKEKRLTLLRKKKNLNS